MLPLVSKIGKNKESPYCGYECKYYILNVQDKQLAYIANKINIYLEIYPIKIEIGAWWLMVSKMRIKKRIEKEK